MYPRIAYILKFDASRYDNVIGYLVIDKEHEEEYWVNQEPTKKRETKKHRTYL